MDYVRYVFLCQHFFIALALCSVVSMLLPSHLCWRLIVKKFVPYLGVRLLLVSETSTIDSLNILHLEIFGLVGAAAQVVHEINWK